MRRSVIFAAMLAIATAVTAACEPSKPEAPKPAASPTPVVTASPVSSPSPVASPTGSPKAGGTPDVKKDAGTNVNKEAKPAETPKK